MSFTLWFTGLSGSGKSTLASLVRQRLTGRGYQVEMLDGDSMRTTLCRDLGYSRQDRDENVRRIGYVSYLLNRHGVIAIVAAISPFKEARSNNRVLIKHYIEAFCCCPLTVVEKRDVKCLYTKARRGEINNFTGVSDIYEEPTCPEITVYTDKETVKQSLEKILHYLLTNQLIIPS
ncbi:MAG: adenylyl-sulfate kinase [Deltaproteobacteria bacterium]|nr:adenylyl-sulfate kinase [Deltaproteobacteria bacterium]MBF0526116.1 adenylyl-sulfate kinase [Deltaproteobacteria bacterium]